METDKVSIIIPIYNEEASLPELLRRLKEPLSSLNAYTEIVLVNDGSLDSSTEIATSHVNETGANKSILISFSRNFGHQAAITAGLRHASGDCVVIMDADLQDPPEIIPELYRLFKCGHEVIDVKRRSRQEGVLLRFCYSFFYQLLARLSQTPVSSDAGDFCLLSRRAVDHMNSFSETHRFHRGLRSWLGLKSTAVEIDRPARAQGASKYTWRSLLKLASDGFFGFSIVPLRLIAILGALAVCCSSAYTLYAVLMRLLTDQSPSGFTAIVVLITFLVGIQLMALGVIGEYIGRIYEQIKNRPPYIIESIRTLGGS